MNIFAPIKKSPICTKVLLDAYSLLRDLLNGECNDDICPHMKINFGMRGFYTDDIKWFKYRGKRQTLMCSFCTKNWFLSGSGCPCTSGELDPEEVFLRLDEVIYLLQEKLNKEYSS